MRALIATAIYPTPERPAFGTFVRTQVESLRGIGVEAEPFVLSGSNRKLMYPLSVGQLRDRLRSDPVVDVLHAHYGLVGMVARAQHQVPLVVTFHGSDLLGGRDERGRITRGSRLVSEAGRALARSADAVIVQSDEMAARLRGVRGVHVIPCEVDLSLFRPMDRADARARLGLDPDRRLVLFAASPAIAVKRYPLALEAIEVLRARGRDAELVVVHDATQATLVEYMNACDALVCTSFQEGSPNVVKQAMACNLPIVATDVGDIRSVIAGTQGCAVVDADAASVASALEDAIGEPARTDGRARVGHLAPDLIARRIRAVYEDLVGAERPATASKV